MSLSTNLQGLATRIATEIKSVRTLINGNAADLSALTTTNKATVVAAINELDAAIVAAAESGGASIDDNNVAASTTWSSSKIDSTIDLDVSAAISALVDGADPALDTLNELAAALQDNDSDIGAITTALDHRVRFDSAQTLTGSEQQQARNNIGAGTSNLVIGTTTGTAAAGNDSRIINAVPNTRTINGKPLDSNIQLTASDVSALPSAYTPPVATQATHGTIVIAGDLTGTASAPTVKTATATAAGKVELATTAEAQAGTDDSRAVTPVGLNAVANTLAPSIHSHTSSQISDASSSGVTVLTGTPSQARIAIDAISATDVGDTEFNLVQLFESGLGDA